MNTELLNEPATAAKPSLAPLLAEVDDVFADFRETERVALLGRLRIGRFLGRLERERAHRTIGYSCVSAIGEAHGLSGAETWTAIHAARACDVDSRIEPLLLDGIVSLQAAGLLDKAFSLPPIEGREAPDWGKLAAEKTTAQLKEAIDDWKACSEAPQPPERVTLFLSPKGRRAFRRATRIAERKAKRELTPGEVLRILAEHFLESFDPLTRRGRRRAEKGLPGRRSRYTPAEVNRDFRRRDDDTCRSPLCGRKRFIQGGHVERHADGGPQEAHNLLCQCPTCNGMCETGDLAISGDANDGVFLDRDGRVILPYKTGRIVRPTLEEYRRDPDAWRPVIATRREMA